MIPSLCSDLANTNASKNGERQLIQIGKLVLVRSFSEVADVGDVDSSVAKVVFYKIRISIHPKSLAVVRTLTLAKVHVSINLIVAFGASVGRVFGDDEAVGSSRGPRLAEESIGFDEHLVIGAALDGLVAVVDVEVVVDVLVAEAAGGAASAAVAL